MMGLVWFYMMNLDMLMMDPWMMTTQSMINSMTHVMIRCGNANMMMVGKVHCFNLMGSWSTYR